MDALKRFLFLMIAASLISSACTAAPATGPANSPEASAPSSAAPTSVSPPPLTLLPPISTSSAPNQPEPRLPTGTPRSTPTSISTPQEASPGTLSLRQDLGIGRGEVSIPAPEIERLAMRQSADGRSVDYFDERGRLILSTEASFLNPLRSEQNTLEEILKILYGSHSVYARSSVYPRFRFPVEGVNSGFYGLDQTLTYPQILQMKAALELFVRPEFIPLRDLIFDERTSYTVIEKLDLPASGLNYVGTRLVLLDRRSLFGNKYLLASVLAHEGSHVLQGKLISSQPCEEILRREVGDQKIPPGFETWDASAVIKGIQDGSLGAYHVSYWMQAQLRVSDRGYLKQVIQTGRANGESIIFCEEK